MSTGRFTEAKQQAINEKVKLLRKVKEGVLSTEELARKIKQRRVSWFQENKVRIYQQYKGLSDIEIAYRAIFLDHMQIDPKYSKVDWVFKTKLRIESYNFCPYLEACRILRLDTRYVCRIIGKPSIQAVMSLINPKLKFSRNYGHIRPKYSYCEEFIELREENTVL